MNELLRSATERLRNELRRQAWAERWRAKFGRYPASYRKTATPAPRLYLDAPGDLQARAAAARGACCFAADLAAPRVSAEIIPLFPTHPTHPERHGNTGLRQIQRHSRQRRHTRPEPPEVA